MSKLKWLLAAGAAVTMIAAGCGSSSSSSSSTSSSGSSKPSTTSVLVGAGSTLVAPLMAQWQPDYAKSAAAVTVTYGAIGSAAESMRSQADGRLRRQ